MMSVIESGEKIVKDIIDISKEKYLISKLSKFVRILCAIVIVCVALDKMFKWNIDYSIVTLELWDKNIRDGLNNSIVYVIIFGGLYEFVLSDILYYILCHIDSSDDAKSLPVLFTIDDLVDFACSIFFLGYTINKLIEIKNGIDNNKQVVLIFAGIYLVVFFIKWLYINNCNNWNSIRNEYTDYYDINRKRIQNKMYVVYYGKRYKIHYMGDIPGGQNDKEKNEWIMISEDGKKILLEEAARDRKGELMIDPWKLGK